ncbi:MAG: phosphatidylglycerophosphatase A, partial [Pseudomonadota bacterium]|nr:phosphatidylglycerophosphatase A [Pseudomonadota bacterium]
VGGWGLAAATAGLFLLGTWAAHHYAARLGRDDPGEIVVDEVVGQWLPLCVLPVEPVAYAIAFVSFRFFDIVKPWPIGAADRRLKGGLGIMIDDVLAGLAAAIVCLAVYAPLARTLLTGE